MADDDGSAVNYDYVSDLHDSEITGVGEVPSTEPTGVDMADLQAPQDVPEGTNADTDFGLEQVPLDDPHERKTARCPIGEPTAAAPSHDTAPPLQGMAAHNARVRKPPQELCPVHARQEVCSCIVSDC